MQRRGNHGNQRLTVKLGGTGYEGVSQDAELVHHDAVKFLSTLSAQFVFHLLRAACEALGTDPQVLA